MPTDAQVQKMLEFDQLVTPLDCTGVQARSLRHTAHMCPYDQKHGAQPRHKRGVDQIEAVELLIDFRDALTAHDYNDAWECYTALTEALGWG